jgi:hypothetical protein
VTRLLVDLAGWTGAGCLLLAYVLLSSGQIPAGRRFQLLNLAGSLGLAINGVVHQAWPSATLNLIWLAVGLTALRLRLRLRPRTPPLRTLPQDQN